MQNLLISEKIKSICRQKKIPVAFLLHECNINRNFIYDLTKKGQSPSIEKISAIADYLNCSIDELVGRNINQSINAGDITNSKVISGNNNTLKENDTLIIQQQDL